MESILAKKDFSPKTAKLFILQLSAVFKNLNLKCQLRNPRS